MLCNGLFQVGSQLGLSSAGTSTYRVKTRTWDPIFCAQAVQSAVNGRAAICSKDVLIDLCMMYALKGPGLVLAFLICCKQPWIH